MIGNEKGTTPAAQWRVDGEPDPFGSEYDHDRSELCGGHMTDDLLANEVFLNPTIQNLPAAKERIRWLSRQVIKQEQEIAAQSIKPHDLNLAITDWFKYSRPAIRVILDKESTHRLVKFVFLRLWPNTVKVKTPKGATNERQ